MSEKYRGYENSAGRRSEVRIEKKEKMGEGAMGVVHEVKARIRHEGQKKEIESLVLKKYKADEGIEMAREHARISLKSYAALKSLNFPVPPTYRLDKETNRILMTNIHVLHPDSIAVTTSKTEGREGYFIKEISNFEAIVHEVLEYAEAATANEIFIGADAYTLTIPRSGSGEAQLFFTDLETVFTRDEMSDWTLGHLRQTNLDRAQEFLFEHVVQQHIPAENRKPYLESIGRIFGARRASLNIRENAIDKELKKIIEP
jgi:hypothetical protein